MGGGDERSGLLFSYVDLEARVGKDHPLRTIRAIVNEALSALAVGGRVFCAVFADRAAVDPAGEAVASDALASLLFNSLGAAVDGAAGVRSAVPLVRWHRRRRRGVGSLFFFPRTAFQRSNGRFRANARHFRLKLMVKRRHKPISDSEISAIDYHPAAHGTLREMKVLSQEKAGIVRLL
jgi:hypothetical protein